MLLEDRVHDFVGQEVHEGEECPRDDDEAEDDAGALGNLTPIGPLYPLELAPASAEEVDDPVALGPGLRGGRVLGAPGGPRLGGALAAHGGGPAGFLLVGLLGLLLDLVDLVLEALELLLVELVVAVAE